MRKIRITESQWKLIMESELSYPLNLKGDDGRPDNFSGYEVAVDNMDKDAPLDVTTSDAIKKSKEGWFGMNRYPAMQRIPEGVELDNSENSGYGLNNDAYIHNAAKSSDAEMVNNISDEINSSTRGSRNNTNEVRLSRMLGYKKSNPSLYQKNGGDEMVKILQSQTNMQSNKHKAATNKKPSKTNTTFGGTTSNGAYYFK